MLLLSAALSENAFGADLGITTAEKTQFFSFVAKQGKSYSNVAEFETRMALWKTADTFIKNYPPSTFTMDHNKFSDWTEQEKKSILGRNSRSTASPQPLVEIRTHEHA